MTDKIYIINDERSGKREYPDPDEVAEAFNKQVEEEREKEDLKRKKEDLEGKLNPKQEKQDKEKNTGPSNVLVKDISDFWRIEGVEYRNGIYTVDLAKQLLPSMTEEQLAEYSIETKKQGKFHGADMPLHYSIFKALYNQKNSKNAKEARELITKQMIYLFLHTLTRINYKANGLDEVVHNYKQDDEYKIQEEIIVGPDNYITNKDKNVLKALIGTDNIKEINNVFEWLVGKEGYIWRLDSKPEQDSSKIAGFYANSEGAGLSCIGIPECEGLSLGVRFVSKAPAKKFKHPFYHIFLSPFL